MIPFTPQQYLTALWNAHFKGRGRTYALRLDVGEDLFVAFKDDTIFLTREVKGLQSSTSFDYASRLPFKTGEVHNTGRPGWDVSLTPLVYR